VLYRTIIASAQDIEASKTLADSIATAVKKGASFTDLAKKYNQPTDSMWVYTAQLEQSALNAQTASAFNTLFDMKKGETKAILSDQGLSMVCQVIDQANVVTKYDLAVVKCPNDFSETTYNNELSKINKFLSENTTVEAIQENALAAGYMVNELPNFVASSSQLEMSIGGTKDAIRWAFDEAEQNEISRLYECGSNKDHLLVLMVKGINKSGYINWNSDADTKTALTNIAKQEKKAALALAKVADAKSMSEAMAVAGVATDTLASATFAVNARTTLVGVAEPALTGAIAKAKAGEFVGPIKGAGAVYFVQVLENTSGEATYNETQEMQSASQRAFSNIIMQSFYGTNETLINVLAEDAEIVDNRYKF
jgi:peptidyl-prolyl cis-trans isomerase D